MERNLFKLMPAKSIFSVLLLASLYSCGEEASGTNKAADFSTVDSNIIAPTDPNLPGLHIDSLQIDTSVRIAMDSVGPTILPQDTGYVPR